MTMIERPQFVNDEIRRLLASGSVADLQTEKGKLFRSFFTADEIDASLDLPMNECPSFDGTTCDYCRGDCRFRNCPTCHGSFDNLQNGV